MTYDSRLTTHDPRLTTQTHDPRLTHGTPPLDRWQTASELPRGLRRLPPATRTPSQGARDRGAGGKPGADRGRPARGRGGAAPGEGARGLAPRGARAAGGGMEQRGGRPAAGALDARGPVRRIGDR